MKRWHFKFSKLSKAQIFFYLNLAHIILIALLSLNSEAFLSELKPGGLSSYQDSHQEFIGRVCAETEADYNDSRLVVCAGREKVLVTTKLYPAYNYGDFLKISGLIQAPPKFDTFDYARYLARSGVYSVMYYPRLELVAGKLIFKQSIYLSLLRGKWALKSILEKSLPEPEAGLATALLLGYRRTINQADKEAFARTGLSHLIAISGSHITIIAAMLAGLASFLGLSRRAGARLIFSFLIIYPLITGLSPSAVRAGIMGGLVFLAFYTGRLGSAVKALVFAASLMLLFEPRLLHDDVGFQLSFLAVLAILYLYPLTQPIGRKIKKRLPGRLGQVLFIFWELFSLTFVCQLAVAPVMLINFRQLSLVSLIANPLVAWIFPFLLAALIIPLPLVGLIPVLGPWLYLPAYLMLTFLFRIARFLAAWPGASLEINNFGFWGVIFYYCILILISSIWYSRLRNK